MNATHLPHLALIEICDKDAATFLQGQLTQNVLTLNENTARFALYCTREGRVKANFLLFKRGDSYYLIVADDLKEKIVSDFKKYILRSQVFISIKNEKIGGIFEPHKEEFLNIEENRIYLNDNRIIQIGGDFILNKALQNKWQFLEIKNRLPWINKNTSELFTPQMLDFEMIAVDFKKGCYLGQEIIARTHYLGKSKRSLFILKSKAQLKSLDFVLNKNKEKIGEVLDSVFYKNFFIVAAVLKNDTTPPFYNIQNEICEVLNNATQ